MIKGEAASFGPPQSNQKGGATEMAMAEHKSILIPNGATRILVCMDTPRNMELCGQWYNPFLPSPVHFQSVLQLLCGMEEFYNRLAFPQEACCCRSFHHEVPQPVRQKRDREVRRYMSDELLKEKRGEKATFVVQVQFRQNASWQGTITWAEQNETRHFRSTLELIKLMDEILDKNTEQPAEQVVL